MVSSNSLLLIFLGTCLRAAKGLLFTPNFFGRLLLELSLLLDEGCALLLVLGILESTFFSFESGRAGPKTTVGGDIGSVNSLSAVSPKSFKGISLPGNNLNTVSLARPASVRNLATTVPSGSRSPCRAKPQAFQTIAAANAKSPGTMPTSAFNLRPNDKFIAVKNMLITTHEPHSIFLANIKDYFF